MYEYFEGEAWGRIRAYSHILEELLKIEGENK